MRGETMKKYWISMLVLLCAGVVFAATDVRRWFVDTRFVYERGSALSSEYLTEHAPGFSDHLKCILPWIVRIEVRHSFTENSYSSNHGTGVILQGGTVLTANHVLTENVKDGEIQVFLTLVDGRILTASVEEQGKRDWARLQINMEDEPMSLKDSPIVSAAVILMRQLNI